MKKLWVGVFLLLFSCERKSSVESVLAEYEVVKDNVVASSPHILFNPEENPEVIFVNDNSRQVEFGKKEGGTWNVVKVGPAYPVDEVGDFIITSRDTEVFTAHDASAGALLLFEKTQAGWTRTVVDQMGDTGYGSKIKEDWSGGFHIFYVNFSTLDLVHSYVVSGIPINETVDPGYIGMTGGGKVMPPISVTVDENGTYHVVYYEGYYGVLKHASQTSEGNWEIEVLNELKGGLYPFVFYSLTCGCLEIAYYDLEERTLLYAEKRENWTEEEPDAGRFVLGKEPKIVEVDGKLFVFYLNTTNFALRTAVKKEGKWGIYEFSISRLDGCPFMVDSFDVAEKGDGTLGIILVDHIQREVGYVEKNVDDF